MSDTTDALEAELRATEIPLAVLSRGNEPPVGTWVRDRHGAVSYRQKGGGWGEPGIMPFGVWTAMWDARGPYVLCGPWGAPTPAESVLSRAADALAAARTENDDLKKWWGRSVRATKKREAERDEARAALAEANRKIELALMNLHGREYAEDCDDMIVVIDGAQKALRGEPVNEGNTDV